MYRKEKKKKKVGYEPTGRFCLGSLDRVYSKVSFMPSEIGLWGWGLRAFGFFGARVFGLAGLLRTSSAVLYLRS